MAQAIAVNGIGEKCKNCEDYKRRGTNSVRILELFGNEGGCWDYETCHETCWQEEDKKTAYQREWARKRVSR